MNNFGILSKKTKHVTPPTKKVSRECISYRLEIDGIYADIFYKEIGFRLQRKQNKYVEYNRSKMDGFNIIPFAYVNYKLKRNGVSKTAKHISKESFYKQHGFVEGVCEPNLYWQKIKDINEYIDKVFDFSLDHVDGDEWCHSVVYNGVLGHQTPKGLNHFYKFCNDAMQPDDEDAPFQVGVDAGKNGFVYHEIPWISGRVS